MHERPAADHELDPAFVAEYADGLAGGHASDAVLLHEALLGRDRPAYLQLARVDPGAQNSVKLEVDGCFALVVDLHMITLSRPYQAADSRSRM